MAKFSVADVLSPLSKWQAEYRIGGIPSSIAKEPSQALLDFLAFLRTRHFPSSGSHLIDLGCGRGRNSIYAALQGFHVTSVDLVQENFGFGTPNIHALTMDVGKHWPLADQSFDAALDVFCFKHLVTEFTRQTYVHEVARTLKPGGYFSLSLAGVDDGYYRQFLDPQSRMKHHITDPGNHIESLLYTLEDLIALFRQDFELAQYQMRRSLSAMHGQEYSRQLHHCIFQRRGIA
jgi:SAM-dependent methyltransferase